MGLVPALQKQSFLTTESYLKQVMDCCSCFLLAFVKMFSAVMLFWRTVIFIHELGVGHVVATKDQMKIARLTIYLLIVQIFILCRCFVLKNGAIFNMSILPQWINNQLFRSRDKFQKNQLHQTQNHGKHDGFDSQGSKEIKLELLLLLFS